LEDLVKTFKETNFLFVVNTYKAFGGAEQQALILANYINKNISDKVCFISFEDGEQFKKMINDSDIETYCFPFNHKATKLQKVLQYYKLVKFLRTLKPDILIPYVAESNKIVAQIWKYTGAHFAFWNQREEGRKLYGTALEKKLINGVSAIVSNSFEGKDALIRAYGLKEDQITVINNGIIPHQDDFDTRDWHKELNIDTNRPLISMIANITKRKDHETLIKAWRQVIDDCKKSDKIWPFLILAGRKDTAYDALRLLAFDLNLSDHMAFVGELNPVQALIEQSLFCVFSSNLEGCPNGVLECMERGKAVVGTNISGLRQALGERYAKVCLSESNQPDDLASKIVDLLNNEELRKDIGLYNANRIRSEFSVEQMVHGYLNLTGADLKS